MNIEIVDTDELYVIVISKVSITKDFSFVPYNQVQRAETQGELIDLAQQAELKLSENELYKAKQQIEGFDELQSGDIVTLTEEIKECILFL